jgi:hypothetical protein
MIIIKFKKYFCLLFCKCRDVFLINQTDCFYVLIDVIYILALFKINTLLFKEIKSKNKAVC